jgi:glycogen debranching enzyme
MVQLNVNRPYPVRVVSSPVERDSPLWRTYMGRYQQNFPYKYHNGGIWPFVGAFWVILLSQLGRKKLASEELYRLAESNRINNWEFNEWFHGKTGKPMGMAGQSWNAAMFILAYRSLIKKISF